MKKNKINNFSYEKKKIKRLRPGEILLHPIYRRDGLMLIKKNKILNRKLINLIKNHKNNELYILVSKDKEFILSTNENILIKNDNYKEDLKEIFINYNENTSTPLNFKDFIKENNIDVDSIFNNKKIKYYQEHLIKQPLWQSLSDKIESTRLKKRTKKVKESLIEVMITDDTFHTLFEKMYNYDDALFINSINTTCISLIIGLTLELNNEDLIDLGLASLFANVGFTEMNKKDFFKFLNNDDYNREPIKEHLKIFNKLANESQFFRKKNIILGILDHHEFYNGNGFPFGKKESNIHIFGRIIKIAQDYDDLVGGNKAQASLTPYKAIKYIYENKENRLDPNILNIFFRRSTFFKLGEKIFINENIKGEIIGFDNYIEKPHLPIIKLVNGNTLNMYKYLQ